MECGPAASAVYKKIQKPVQYSMYVRFMVPFIPVTVIMGDEKWHGKQ